MFGELKILRKLDHPNILKVYDLFQDENYFYLITEYCSGGELFDKIKKSSNISEKIAADYIKQLLSVLVHMHQHKIVHRDLKPENLLLEHDSKNSPIKVIDFGTCRHFEQNKMQEMISSPFYIAPEVLDGNYDEKCDVGSFGIVLYILLCGYPPFTGNNEKEIIEKIRIG